MFVDVVEPAGKFDGPQWRHLLLNLVSRLLHEVDNTREGDEGLQDVGGSVIVLQELALLQLQHGGALLGHGLGPQQARARLHDEVRSLRGINLHDSRLHVHVRVLAVSGSR